MSLREVSGRELPMTGLGRVDPEPLSGSPD